MVSKLAFLHFIVIAIKIKIKIKMRMKEVST